MADVAATLELPVLLVVGLRLGCLNHALLTAQAIERSGVELAGWVANHVQPRFEHAPENIATLAARLRAPARRDRAIQCARLRLACRSRDLHRRTSERRSIRE